MTESELDKYLQKRCSETSFETPDFDSFFTEKELSAALGKSSRIVPIRRLWPWMTVAAAAIAAAIIWIAPADRHQEAPYSLALQNNPESVMDNDIVDIEADNLDLASVAVSSSSTEADPAAVRIRTAETHKEVGNGAEPQTVSSYEDEPAPMTAETSADEEFDSASIAETATGAEAERKPESVVEPLTYYERTVEEAYAEARAQRKDSPKKQFQGTKISLAFNQDNSIRQGTPNAQSPVSMITRTYASGMGLRSASLKKNEWLQPTIFPSQIAEYKPVYELPLVFSLSASIPVGRFLDLHTGLTYTYLSANTQGTLENGSSFSIDQSLHYLGIPLSLALNVLERPRFGFYVAAGGGIEKGLVGCQFVQVNNRLGNSSYERLRQPVRGIQPYLSAQIGLSYSISEMMQFFVEPSISYYLDTDQPLSIRTRQPFYYGLGFGIRLIRW